MGSKTPEAGHGPLRGAIGLDVGGTKMAAGLVTSAGEIATRRLRPTRAERGGEAVLQDALDLVREVLAARPAAGPPIAGLGVGVAELVSARGEVLSSQTIRWRGLPVLESFRALGPAVVEADSRAAALGEALWGAGRDFRSFYYVTVGTGIGGAYVVDGTPHCGARGCSGTIATSPLPAGIDETSGLVEQSIEDLASGPALVRRYAAAGGTARCAEEVARAAEAGDDRAARIISSAAAALGGLLGLLVNTLDPEAVVVGGGLGSAGGLYFAELEASARRHIWSEVHRDLPILRARHGGDAGLVGAAATALRRFS